MKRITFLAVATLSCATVLAQEDYKFTDNQPVREGRPEAMYKPVQYIGEPQGDATALPKNIILFIGDGMGVAQIFSAMTANGGDLYISQFNNIGFSKTNSFDNYVTDSAAGGSAIACGHKTRNGMIGLMPDSARMPSILELCKKLERMSTGLVATSSIVHATPASFVAHVPDRGQYEDIALAFLDQTVDVFIGGGRDFFYNRTDGRNLANELTTKGYRIYSSLGEAEADNDPKLGILNYPTHMPDVGLRDFDLAEATAKAINILKKNENGFFMMVEGSQIDWGGHQNTAPKVVEELLDFDKAVGRALEFAAADGNTLVIITADHETGGMAVLGGSYADGRVEAAFATGNHSALMVPVFAYGPGAHKFRGVYHNTQIFHNMADLLGIWK